MLDGAEVSGREYSMVGDGTVSQCADSPIPTQRSYLVQRPSQESGRHSPIPRSQDWPFGHFSSHGMSVIRGV
jgi:hypothetical protein